MKFKNIEFTSYEVRNLLEQLGFTNITEYHNLFQFSWYEGANPKGSCLYKDTMTFSYWSKNIHGDLIDLIKTKVGCNFSKAMTLFYKITHKMSIDFKNRNIYEEFINGIKTRGYKTYDKKIYEEYPPCISEVFLKDDVGVLAQRFFDVRIDEDSNRVIFPIKDLDGNIVGVLGRYNAVDVPNNIAKYLPIIPYEKRLFLYGAYENKDFLHDTIIMVESEKSVMKAFSKGYRNVVALGGNYFSSDKYGILYDLKPKNVILALDEGLDDNHIIETARSLISPNPFIQWHVGYIPSNDVGLGRKNNIFDENREICYDILRNKVIFIC